MIKTANSRAVFKGLGITFSFEVFVSIKVIQ